MRIKLPKRNDTIYTDVENFEEYELTNNLVYEMLIRKKGLERVILNSASPVSISQLSTDDIVLYHGLGSINFKVTLSNYIQRIFPTLHDDTWEVIKKELKVEENKDNAPLISTKTSYRLKNLKYLISNYINDESKVIDNILYYDEITSEEYIFTRDKLRELIENATRYSREVYPRFKRPLVANTKARYVDLMNINLSLPIKELEAYIRMVKINFHQNLAENNYAVISASELLENKLTLADTIIEKNNGKKIDAKKSLSNKEKAADMLYIYDCNKLGFSHHVVSREIYYYYSEYKNIETKTMTDKTYSDYKEIAIDYIDNERFYELITGVKSI